MHDQQLNYFLILCVLTVAGVILPSYEVFAAPDMLVCHSASAIADYHIVGDVSIPPGDDRGLTFS